MSVERYGLTYDAARDKLFALICENARVLRDELADDKALKADLHLDSFDFIGVLSAVEGEFGVSISDDEAKQLVTVADVCNALWAKLA